MCSEVFCKLFFFDRNSHFLILSVWYHFNYLSLPKQWEKTMALHSSTLAWKIPWPEEPGRLQSTKSWTRLSDFTFMHWRRKWQPTPVFLPGESQGWGSLVGCCLWGHRVRHNWSNLTAEAKYHKQTLNVIVALFVFKSH